MKPPIKTTVKNIPFHQCFVNLNIFEEEAGHLYNTNETYFLCNTLDIQYLLSSLEKAPVPFLDAGYVNIGCTLNFKRL